MIRNYSRFYRYHGQKSVIVKDKSLDFYALGEVLKHSPEGNFWEMLKISILDVGVKIIYSIL